MRYLGLVAFITAQIAVCGCVHTPVPWATDNKQPDANSTAKQPLEGTVSGDAVPPKKAAVLNLKMAVDLERAGKDSEAILYYEQARQLDPTMHDRAGRRLAVLYDLTDNQAQALAEFQELVKRKPKDSTLLNDLGYHYYNRGQWTEAEVYLRRSVTADAKNKQAWVNLGLALAQQGKTAESLDAFGKAVTMAGAYQNLGFVLTAQGNRDAAMEAYRKSLELEPTSQTARAAMLRLEGGLSPAPKPVLQPLVEIGGF